MSRRIRILALLKEHGPMTAREIAEELDIPDVCAVRAALAYIPGGGPKDYHIAGYRRDNDGGRLYPRALYAAGPGEDAKKLKPLSSAECQRRWKKVRVHKAASVFEFAAKVQKYHGDRA